MPSIVILRAGLMGYRYKLTVNHNVHNAVACEPNTADYAAATRVTLTAMPGDNWSFWYWRGDLHGSDNPTEILMDGHKQVTAAFKKQAQHEEEGGSS